MSISPLLFVLFLFFNFESSSTDQQCFAFFVSSISFISFLWLDFVPFFLWIDWLKQISSHFSFTFWYWMFPNRKQIIVSMVLTEQRLSKLCLFPIRHHKHHLWLLFNSFFTFKFFQFFFVSHFAFWFFGSKGFVVSILDSSQEIFASQDIFYFPTSIYRPLFRRSFHLSGFSFIVSKTDDSALLDFFVKPNRIKTPSLCFLFSSYITLRCKFTVHKGSGYH